jgi:hypothetical protein
MHSLGIVTQGFLGESLAMAKCPKPDDTRDMFYESPNTGHEWQSWRMTVIRNDAVGLGGTANLAVLGGNRPPSRTHGGRPPFRAGVGRTAVGRVARQIGPVASSTHTPTERFQWEKAH